METINQKFIKGLDKEVQKIRKARKPQRKFWDMNLRGFGVVISLTGSKNFILRAIDPDGKQHERKIGSVEDWTESEARSNASITIAEIQEGEIVESGDGTITLARALEDYCQIKTDLGQLAKRTADDYLYRIPYYFGDWLSKDLSEITETMIEQRFAKITKETGGENGGKRTANTSLKALRILFRYWSKRLPTGNPMSIMNGQWHHIPRKKIDANVKGDLPVILKAIIEYPCTTMRNMVLMMYFTGMRLSEVQRLQWSDINEKNQFLRLAKTKNGEPLELPLLSVHWEIINQQRILQFESDDPRRNFVFPADRRCATPWLRETKTLWTAVEDALNVEHDGNGYRIANHDLRRNFASEAARSVPPVPQHITMQLLNHTESSVTEGYQFLDTDDLRPHLQTICDGLTSKAKITGATQRRNKKVA